MIEAAREVWTGTDQDICVGLCLALKDVGIEYEVIQTAVESLAGMQVVWKFQLVVPTNDFERAKQVLAQAVDLPIGLYLTNSHWLELPAAEERSNQEPPTSESYAQDWFPENATVQLWSQSDDETSSMVKLSLDANNIQFRTAQTSGGEIEIYVRPEDVSRAREIIRQVRNGVPPK